MEVVTLTQPDQRLHLMERRISVLEQPTRGGRIETEKQFESGEVPRAGRFWRWLGSIPHYSAQGPRPATERPGPATAGRQHARATAARTLWTPIAGEADSSSGDAA